MSAGGLFLADTPQAGNTRSPMEDSLTAVSMTADLSLRRIGKSVTRKNWLRYCGEAEQYHVMLCMSTQHNVCDFQEAMLNEKIRKQEILFVHSLIIFGEFKIKHFKTLMLKRATNQLLGYTSDGTDFFKIDNTFPHKVKLIRFSLLYCSEVMNLEIRISVKNQFNQASWINSLHPK